MSWRILEGDCLPILRTLDAESVQTCVTSPPYWGLRDYGTATWEGGDSDCKHEAGPMVSVKSGLRVGEKRLQNAMPQRGTCSRCGARRIDSQLGLEATPEEYVANLVAVFREVRRVLRDDGTLWLNLGDSYAAGGTGGYSDKSTLAGFTSPNTKGRVNNGKGPTRSAPAGFKPKDLVGIPWAVAEALRDPYYLGQIAEERDRVWLAATLDAEGTICGSTHVRKDNGQTRTSLNISITNADTRMLDEAQRIWPTSRQEHNCHGEGHLGNRPTFRWIPHGAEAKGLLCRELLPYLVVKRKQALLGWRFCELSVAAKRLARSPQAKQATEQRAWIVDALSRLNKGQDVDIPTWVGELPSLTEPGWYLRSDIIWAKPNPMPESVTDRPTKAHEYLFLLTKSPRYFYDASAIREDFADERMGNPGAYEPRYQIGSARNDSNQIGANGDWNGADRGGRNKRSVWTVTTQPFPGAHFATFPPKLIEPCVLAGSSPFACGRCRAPWERETKITRPATRAVRSAGPVGDHGLLGKARRDDPVEVETLGWRTPCKHDDDTGRSLILDPFAGAGTTGVVATRHDRDFIGIELNPEYAEMARNRIRDDAPLLNVQAEAA